MLFVVVPLVMALLVEFSLFTSSTTLVLPTGALAPPYHLNLYICIIFIKVVVLIIVFVVVAVGVVLGVASLMLASTVILVMASGMLAPPYHLNHIFIVIILLKIVVVVILIVVVTVALGPFVGFSMFASTILLLGLHGTMAPPYHLNHI